MVHAYHARGSRNRPSKGRWCKECRTRDTVAGMQHEHTPRPRKLAECFQIKAIWQSIRRHRAEFRRASRRCAPRMDGRGPHNVEGGSRSANSRRRRNSGSICGRRFVVGSFFQRTSYFEDPASSLVHTQWSGVRRRGAHLRPASTSADAGCSGFDPSQDAGSSISSCESESTIAGDGQGTVPRDRGLWTY